MSRPLRILLLIVAGLLIGAWFGSRRTGISLPALLTGPVDPFSVGTYSADNMRTYDVRDLTFTAPPGGYSEAELRDIVRRRANVPVRFDADGDERSLRFLGGQLFAEAAPDGHAEILRTLGNLRYRRAVRYVALASILPGAIAMAALLIGEHLFTHPRRLRRLRLARGQCVACGYDLRGSSGRCPECGLAAA